MNTIEYTFGGKTVHLYLNGEAMFAISALDDQLPEGAPEILELMKQHTPEGIDARCRVAQILAQQGENCRRYLGYSPERVPDAGELKLLLTPVQQLGLLSAVYRAINSGYEGGAANQTGDIDLGLAELEKKTKL